MRKKIIIRKNAKHWQDKYPMVAVKWKDICSDSSWQSMVSLHKSELQMCVTKGHLLTQQKGITRIFGDYQTNNKGELEELGNTTIIPNSVIVDIKKI